MRKQIAAAVALFALSLIFLWRASPDGDVVEFSRYGHAVLDGRLPYRDFHLEYPPGAIPLFTLPALGEYVTWFRLENALAWIAVIVLAGLLLDTLRPADRRNGLLLACVALLPLLLGPFTLMRFDGWPTALVLAALLCLVRRRPSLALALLGVATVVKAWPIALLPVFWLYGVPRRALLAFALVLFAVLVPFTLLTPGGAYNGLMAQPNRHLEYESIGASVLLAVGAPVRLYFETGSFSVAGSGANALATLHSLFQLALVAAVAFLFWRSRRDPRHLVAASAATVAVAAAFGKVLSPQFLLWVVPFVALVDGMALLLFLGAALATRGVFDGWFGSLRELNDGAIALLAVRNALLVGTTGALLKNVRR
jgi:uncharacterized membrane protein